MKIIAKQRDHNFSFAKKKKKKDPQNNLAVQIVGVYAIDFCNFSGSKRYLQDLPRFIIIIFFFFGKLA